MDRTWRSIIAASSVAVAAGLGVHGVVVAGEYHVGETLVCDECHSGGATDESNTMRPRRLTGGEANAICLRCHDGTPGIPDVIGDDVNAMHGPRQAGALPTGARPYEHWKGHTLGSTDVPPGGRPSAEPAVGLRCVSCHAPHGNASYRNLSGVIVTYAVSTAPSNRADVRIDLPSVPAVGTRVEAGFYSSTRVFFNQPSPLGSAYGAFCAGCHAEFHGTAKTGAASPFRRHPVDGVPLRASHATRLNAHANKVPVSFTANHAGAMYTTGASVSCASCHKAHGNRNPFGLLFVGATGRVTEQGTDTGTIRDLCAQCHNESR